MKTTILTLGAAALAFGLSGPAFAGQGNNGHAQHGSQAHGDHANHTGSAPKPKVKVKRLKACPPGLAKKHNGCLPPGQWRKGDHLPVEWTRQFTAYGSLPDFYRSRYDQDSRRRYLLQEGKVFVVEAATNKILDIIAR